MNSDNTYSAETYNKLSHPSCNTSGSYANDSNIEFSLGSSGKIMWLSALNALYDLTIGNFKRDLNKHWYFLDLNSFHSFIGLLVVHVVRIVCTLIVQLARLIVSFCMRDTEFFKSWYVSDTERPKIETSVKKAVKWIETCSQHDMNNLANTILAGYRGGDSKSVKWRKFIGLTSDSSASLCDTFTPEHTLSEKKQAVQQYLLAKNKLGFHYNVVKNTHKRILSAVNEQISRGLIQ